MPDATNDDLTGYGFSPHQSELLGANPAVLAGVGTAQVGAAVILSRNTEITTGAGATAVVLPSNARVMSPYFCVTQSSTSALVFVPSGHTLNATANGNYTLAQTKSVIMYQYKPKVWTFNSTST